MDRAPPEIWHHIFSFACRDSGHIGRVLSLVSKSVRKVSTPIKLQSIAIHGPQEITAFARVLNNTPPQLRRVRFLYIDKNEPHRLEGAALGDDSDTSDEPANISKRQQTRMAKEVGEILNIVKESLEILELDMPNRSISQQFNPKVRYISPV